MFWNITKFLLKDTDYVAWYPMIKAVEYMICTVGNQNTNLLLNKFKNMFHGLLQNIGYHERVNESDLTKYLREEAVKWACILGKPTCRLMATIDLEKYLLNSTLDLPLRWKQWIYCKGLMVASDSIWRQVYEKWIKTEDNTFLEYLTCSINSKINENYLRLIEHENTYGIKSKKGHVDHIAIIIVIITHDTSRSCFEKIKKFVKNNMTMSDKLVNAIQQKIKKRIEECQKQVKNYGSLRLF